MNLISIRIITSKIEELIVFYEQITGGKAIRHTPDFAEIKTPKATLAIGSVRTLQFFGGNAVAEPAHNRSVIIEFMVDDVQQRFDELSELLNSLTIVQEPTIMPWGNKSLLLRDPDGNLVNLFTPLTAEAIARV
ncbi:MAG: glyoxalase [Citrobacter freundii]|nr:MAG: glyoxalase [Citrobacter freundii]